MTEVASIPRRLNSIKKLAKEYYELDIGVLIPKHDELTRVFDIRGSKHENHPHKMARVYISRKAVKHFVESRKVELSRSHTKEEALKKICFALDKMQEALTDFDRYEYEPPKHFYIKDYSHLGESVVRILVEKKANGLEIVSIHFTRRRK